jgi:phycocyanobilin lyase beta subunit
MTDNTLAQRLIRAVEEADSSAKLLDAVQQLAAARLEAAIPTLIAALGYNNPGAAVAAVDGLVQIGEASVLPLLQLIDSYNYGARAWAIRALAGIGDPRALNTLLDAAKNDFALSVRRAAARGLGTVRWSELPSEQVQTAQAQAVEALMLVSQDPEWIVRYSAVVGLQALAIAVSVTQPDLVLQILAQLARIVETDPELAVRTRVRLAQQQLQGVAGANGTREMVGGR